MKALHQVSPFQLSATGCLLSASAKERYNQKQEKNIFCLEHEQWGTVRFWWWRPISWTRVEWKNHIRNCDDNPKTGNGCHHKVAIPLLEE
ncbi:MAG: hypothetical protein ABIS36_23635 [Chryseolinea sp.]